MAPSTHAPPSGHKRPRDAPLPGLPTGPPAYPTGYTGAPEGAADRGAVKP
jgi:hypothetical protein